MRTPAIPPVPISHDIYPSPWSAPATISRPRRRSVALAAPPGPRANGRDEDPAPAHAAAPGAAHPSRGPNQLASLGCVENFETRPRIHRRLPRLHAPGRAVVVRVPSPSPSTGERRRPRHAAHPSSSPPALRPPPPTGNWPPAGGPRGLPPPVWAGWPAPTAPPPPRAEATGTSDGGCHGAPAVGPSAWPGASRLVIPLPARPLRLAVRRSQPPSRAPLARWLLASLYTPRPHLGGEVPRKP